MNRSGEQLTDEKAVAKTADAYTPSGLFANNDVENFAASFCRVVQCRFARQIDPGFKFRRSFSKQASSDYKSQVATGSFRHFSLNRGSC